MLNHYEYFCLSPKEEAAMNVLWNTEDALSASEIAAKIPNRNWPSSSIQSILRNLEKKNAIKVESITKLGKSYGRLFRPTLTANEYAAMQFQRFFRKNQKDGFSVLSSLLGDTNIENKELSATLQSLLEEFEHKET